MVLLTVTLLGGFDARLASGASLRLPKKAQALLAYGCPHAARRRGTAACWPSQTSCAP